MTRPLTAVIDVGSNTVRLIVARVDDHRDVTIVAEEKRQLQLSLKLDSEGNLPEDCVDQLVDTLQDYRRVADATGVEEVVTVGTAAIRTAVNRAEIIEKVRHGTGLEIRVLSADDEAHYAFFGALSGMSDRSGIVIDVGGGSVELARFRDRIMVGSWSLGIGAVTAGRRFISSDPPDEAELHALQSHLESELADAALPGLEKDDSVIGVGGTVRNLAKIHRRETGATFGRLHGYCLPHANVARLIETLSRLAMEERRAVRGLNPDRAESIVPGAVVVDTLLKHLGAETLRVSGSGLREGLLIGVDPAPRNDDRELMRRSIFSLGSRFSTWSSERAMLRARICVSIANQMLGQTHAETVVALEAAALIIDAGSSIDFYRRYENAANILEGGTIFGISRAGLALASSALRLIDDASWSARRFRGSILPGDEHEVRVSSAILGLADAISRRLSTPPSSEKWLGISGGVLELRLPELADWDGGEVRELFCNVTGLGLKLLTGPENL